MDKKLFNDREEEKIFYDLLANRKLKKLTKNKESYDSDINEDLSKCEEILTRNNAKINYVSELLKLNKEDAKNPEISKKIAELNKEFSRFLNTLTLVDKEDLEFYSKRIANRLERIAETELTSESLNTFYPNLGNYEYEDRMQIFDQFFGEKNSYKVTPIKEPKEVQKEIIKEVPKVEKEPMIIKNEEPKREEVFGIRSFITEPVIEKEEPKPDLEEKDIKIEDNDMSPDFIYEEPTKKETFIPNSIFELDNINEKSIEIEKEPILNEIKETKLDTLNPFDINLEEPKEESVKFVMPEGASLADISIALCGYSSGWLDIFAENKDLFNEIILKNNLSYINIENNTEAFTGIEINIPLTFKKNIDKEDLKTI